MQRGEVQLLADSGPRPLLSQMVIDDKFAVAAELRRSEERSQLIPGKDAIGSGLAAFFALVATASTGAEAVAAAATAGLLTVAGDIVASAGRRRLSEFVSSLHDEFVKTAVTKEHLDKCLTAASKRFEELLAESVVRASEAKSSERVRRIARLLARIILSDKELQVEEARAMLEIAGNLFDHDAFVLGRMYDAQRAVVQKRHGQPELNEIVANWRKLREANLAFREGSVYSSCSRLQSHGLVLKVEPGTGQFDLQTYMFAVTEFGFGFAIGVFEN